MMSSKLPVRVDRAEPPPDEVTSVRDVLLAKRAASAASVSDEPDFPVK